MMKDIKEMASASSKITEIYDNCKKKPIFSRTIMCSTKLYYGRKIQKNDLQSRQVLKNHEKLTGRIGKRGSDIHTCRRGHDSHCAMNA